MPRGGHRPGAGRKADPNSARQRKLAQKAAAMEKPRGLTMADGTKAEEAGAAWPFGKAPADKPQTETEVESKVSFRTPMEYWEYVLQDPGASASAKHAAAYALAPYVHPKIAPQGKKEAKNEAARKSKFAPAVPPRLVAAGGKKV